MEKRKSQRQELAVFVDHVLGEDEQCVCVSADISRGGIQVAGVPGTGWGQPRHVWLTIRLPDQNQTPIRALGELRYEREQDDGIHLRGYRFKYMSPRERCQFNQFLDLEHTA